MIYALLLPSKCAVDERTNEGLKRPEKGDSRNVVFEPLSETPCNAAKKHFLGFCNIGLLKCRRRNMASTVLIS